VPPEKKRAAEATLIRRFASRKGVRR
jgi:hypothetical protein